MADQIALIQEAANRGILPDNLKPIYQEAVSRGLIKTAMNNGQGPGYISSDTGQFTPIQNAGQQAQAPTGNAALGALQGLTNSVLGAGNAISAGAYAALTPHSGMDEASQNFDKANQFLQGNQIGPSNDPITEAARQAVQGAASKIAGAPQAFFDKGANLVTGLSNKLPWAPQVNQFINQHPALQKFEALTQGAGDIAANTLLPAIAGKTAGIAKTGITQALDTPLATARGLNYKIIPSEAALKGGSAPVGKLIEGLAGSAKTGVSAVMDNQPVTNGLAATDVAKTAPALGITSKTEMTPQILDKARAPNNAVYNEVASLSDSTGKIVPDAKFKNAANNVGDPTANDFGENPDITALREKYLAPQQFSTSSLLREVKSLRKNATSNYKAANSYQSKDAPELGNLADAQQDMADALEDQLDRFVQNIPGKQDLVSRWRVARKNLAVINSVDSAIKEGTTDVSAEHLAKQMNRGVPLSDNLQKIADMQNNFPISIRDVTRVRNKVPINALEGIMGTGGLGAAVLGQPHLGAGLVAGMIARPLAREGLLSTPFQNSMLPKAPIDPMLWRTLLAGAPAALNAQNQNPLLGNQK